MVLVNPNNPSGTIYSDEQVGQLFHLIEQKNGLLIIDEAFMDCSPQNSFIRQTTSQQLIVLRSVGKFFGLAGLRLGMAFASKEVIAVLNKIKPPYNVNSISQIEGLKALKNTKKFLSQIDVLKSVIQNPITISIKARMVEMFLFFGMSFDIYKQEDTGTANYLTITHSVVTHHVLKLHHNHIRIYNND